MTDAGWGAVARRAIAGLGVQPDEIVHLRDQAGRPEVVQEILLAIEQAGATPLLEVMAPAYVARLLGTVDPARLARWDHRRAAWIEQADRVLVLGGDGLRTVAAPAPALAAWNTAITRLTVLEEERRLPFLLLGVPTETRARALGRTLADLDQALLPALAAPAEALRREIDRVLGRLEGRQHLAIRSSAGDILHLQLGPRCWLDDDGLISPEDAARGAIASNLPGGSVYTTVVESTTEGSLWLPEAGPARDVRLRFAGGRIVDIAAASGAGALEALFAQHTGEPRRVSHIGIGLNPYLHSPLGWTLIDEHVHGYLFLALGENRYMGGENESSLNVDYALPGMTLLADDEVVVAAGKVTV